jgi:hypothetical protein
MKAFQELAAENAKLHEEMDELEGGLADAAAIMKKLKEEYGGKGMRV